MAIFRCVQRLATAFVGYPPVLRRLSPSLARVFRQLSVFLPFFYLHRIFAVYRQLLTVVLLSGAILSVHTHCILTHGSHLVRRIQRVDAGDATSAEESPCEDESGCICKGATLKDNAAVVDCPPVATKLVLLCARPLDISVRQPQCSHAAILRRPLIFRDGAAARAWLQSFLL
ncbi:MAG: hypothetical protein KDA60_05420 [Planctomycetales bacterium]|nr:hypothetical protein [Planctomycetales bacterium]